VRRIVVVWVGIVHSAIPYKSVVAARNAARNVKAARNAARKDVKQGARKGVKQGDDVKIGGFPKGRFVGEMYISLQRKPVLKGDCDPFLIISLISALAGVTASGHGSRGRQG